MKKCFKKINGKISVAALLFAVALAGIFGTVAFTMANTGQVTNWFFAADHSTSIEEHVDGELNKDVRVKNNGKSDAFIRVRIVVSPREKVELVYAKNAFNQESADGYWIADLSEVTGEGYYYFSEEVPYGEATTQLLDAVAPCQGFTDLFDVTVYEESCVAKSFPSDTMTEQEKLSFLRQCFDEAVKETGK